MRSLLVVLVLGGLAACDRDPFPVGAPLAVHADLQIVAHQDDDLLFMQPDLLDAIRGGHGVTTVYVTAGNGNHGIAVAEARYAGLRAAYGAAAGAHDWACGWIEIAGHAAEHCTLPAAGVSLVFLGFPDGGERGDHATSLRRLSEGKIASATTIAPMPTSYDAPGLVDTLREIIDATRPARIRTLDLSASHGVDHADHQMVGALALLALARVDRPVDLIAYRGYNMVDEPANKVEPFYAEARDLMARYEACERGCAPCGQACPTILKSHVRLLHRRYAIGFRSNAAGLLASGGLCATPTPTGAIAMVDCATAATWTLAPDGQLHTSDSCVAIASDGTATVAACTAAPDHRMFLDDEGHLWTGIAPAAAQQTPTAHAGCLAPNANGVAAIACGAAFAPRWELAPVATAVARPFPATGRAVRLVDLTGDGMADLCAIVGGGLWCAPGDGTGHFGAAIRIDTMPALAIDPASLTVGDVDGDGRPDACGRDAVGVICARAATGYAGERWSTEFSDPDSTPSTPSSLTAIAADGGGPAAICGLAQEGVMCTARGAVDDLRSSWPDPQSIVWMTELDGDQRADWCSATADGLACGVRAEADRSTDGALWAYAFGGVPDLVAPDPALTAFADINGDHRDDVCTIDGLRITCAHSQGHGFGPRSTFATLTAPASALWLGDLDGDGRADACVDLGATIACAVAP